MACQIRTLMTYSVEFSFYALEKTRENAIKLIESLDAEAINSQLPGFNNTAAWNFCHGVVTTLLLTCGISGLDTGLNACELAKFRKGSLGNLPVTEEEIQRFIALAKSSQDELKRMYQENTLSNFQAYETSYGVTLNSIEEALHFVGMHEALHLGYMMAIRRALSA